MAALQVRNDSYRILFRYKGRQYSYSVGKVSPLDAQVALTKVENILGRLKAHLQVLPDGVDIVTFIHFDGKLPENGLHEKKETTFAELRDAFLETIGNGSETTGSSSIEENTLYTVKIHLAHFAETLGEGFPMDALTLKDLQKHIDRRRKNGPKGPKRKEGAKGEGKKRRKPLAAITMKKEIDTMRAAWNWGARMGYVDGEFPSGGLVYPKDEEKLPFMTWDEIERRIRLGGNPEKLWECLYLRATKKHPEIAKLLGYVKARQATDWIYPMFLTAAHTAARRSELIRAKAEDVDLAAGIITIWEKKRKRGTITTRRVPLSDNLAAVLSDWMEGRKGKPYLFGEGTKPISPQAAQHAFERVLRGSRWEVLKGWHVLRHSFVSALASKGIDQRIIDDFVGHQTEGQRKRYRHIYPSTKEKAIGVVFD